MKHQLQTIREALLDARSLLHDGRRQDKALTALSDLESSLAQYEAGDMASAAAQGFRDGVASVTQQPQAEPDIHEVQGQIEFLDRKNNALSAAIRKVMARLADLLDEDQFKEIEETISSVGVQPQAEAVPSIDALEQEIYEHTREFVPRSVMDWMLQRYYPVAPQQAEALLIADQCDESAKLWANEVRTRRQAAALLRTQHADIERKDALLRQALEALEFDMSKFAFSAYYAAREEAVGAITKELSQ